MGILLQSNPGGVNADLAQNFGITNITSLYNAGVSVSEQLQKVCIPVIAIAFLFKLFTVITKIYNEKQVDFFGIGKLLLLVLFLTQYQEVMTQFNTLISYFTDNIQMMFDKYGTGNTIVDKINKIYDNHATNNPDPGMFSGLSNIMDWIIANCTHLIIIVTRALVYIIRSLIMVFMFAIGPIAILASMFSIFDDTLKSFLRYYISVGFWTVTLAVLDLILYQYLDYCEKTNTIDGVTTINIGMALMYLVVPYLTARYIGGQGGQFMSKMIQYATTAIALSTRVSKGISPTAQLATESGINTGLKFGKTVDNILAGGGNNTLAGRAGQFTRGIRNNIINKNKAE